MSFQILHKKRSLLALFNEYCNLEHILRQYRSGKGCNYPESVGGSEGSKQVHRLKAVIEM